MNTLQEDRSKS